MESISPTLLSPNSGAQVKLQSLFLSEVTTCLLSQWARRRELNLANNHHILCCNVVISLYFLCLDVSVYLSGE